MKKQFVKIVYFVLFAFVLVACQGNKTTETIPLGEVEDNIYQNKELGVTLELLPKWVTLSQEQNKQLLENYQKENISANKMQILLSTMQHPMGIEKFNPNILLIAEIISENQKVHTPIDYLKLTLKELKSKFPNSVKSSDITAYKIGNITTKSMELVFQEGVLKQRYYAFKIENMMLSFIVSFQTNEELEIIDNTLQTLHVEK